MSLLGSLWKSLAGLAKSAKGDPHAVVRRGLTGALPGTWASDHHNETLRACEGWQFVAIRAVSRMCSQAELTAHEVGTKGEKRQRIRSAARWAKLTGRRNAERYWKARLARLKRKAKRRKNTPTSGGVENDRRPLGDNHPLVRLLRRVNPEWSLATFLFAAAQQLCATGSALIWAVREVGVVREMYVLPTGLCQQRGPSAAFPEGSYYLRPLSYFGLSSSAGVWESGTLGSALMTGCEIDFRDVKPIRWPHPLFTSDGLSAVSAIRLWVDVANSQDLSCFASMQNTPNPGMVIRQVDATVPIDPVDQTRFDEWLTSDAAGPHHAGKHVRLPAGYEAEFRTRAPAEMDYENGRQSYRKMNLAGQGVSDIACGIMEPGSRAGYVAAICQTIDQTVQPTLSLIAGELTELLGGGFDGPRCELGLNARGVNDPAELEAAMRTDILAGNAVRVDEYRARRGLPPLGGELGRAFVGQKTTVKVEDSDPEKPGIQGGGRNDDGTARDDRKP